MITALRRQLIGRRLRRLNARLEDHCENCKHCVVAAWGNRQQRRRAGNPQFCHRGQAILLELDRTLAQLHRLYPDTDRSSVLARS